ncbi:type I-E CRISPR-associated protein Cas6/Cse3/CasE [Teredinibacter haidensis]|uniref:type I-E CRISPR-associated protein Cas6/Cse3/CasE n=1 Tax=Teredinibacter haidensis TaxID=2731755 RepID=UPI000948F1AE|nr:type I-E CRISPR-associated protein Cas6/Cse3/CasE [Teredinibacter haidensis]
MYLSKICVVKSSQSVKELLRIGANGSYASHQLLWTLFTKEMQRGFLYREEIGHSGLPEYFVLSGNKPTNNEALFNIQSKIYQPALEPGDRLAFRLRANPTISIKDEAGRSKKHDVLMHAKRKAKQQGILSAEKIKEVMEDAARRWIADNERVSGWGITLDVLPEIERYAQHQSSKVKGEKIRFSSVDFQGVLTVVDVDKFLSQLTAGFGRAKAFGCGLMLIRRI